MHLILTQKKPIFDTAIEHLQKELGALRTGRATPALVESIMVSAYDSMMDIKSIASIQSQDAKTLLIEPWDKSLKKNIEKAIRDAGTGLNPVVDSGSIRIIMPAMTKENRKQMVKKMKEILEEAKVAVRQIREDARAQITKMEKDKAMGEDEKFMLLDELDKMTKEFVDKVDAVGKKKEEEIMTV